MQDILKIVLKNSNVEKSYGCLNLKVWFCNSTSLNVAIAASQMQAKLPARVKVNKITYWLAYRRVQIEILFVGKEHLFHLIKGQTSQKALHRSNRLSLTASTENLRWHGPKSWQLEIHFRDAPNGSVAHSKRFGNLTGTFARTWAGPLESRSCRRQQRCSAQSSWFWPSTATLTSHSRSCLGNVATDRLQCSKLSYCFAGYLDLMAWAPSLVRAEFEYTSCLRTISYPLLILFKLLRIPAAKYLFIIIIWHHQWRHIYPVSKSVSYFINFCSSWKCCLHLRCCNRDIYACWVAKSHFQVQTAVTFFHDRIF